MSPSYLLSEFKQTYQIHSYNTRGRDLPRLPLARTTKYLGSFRISGVRTYNALPLSLTQLDKLNEFKIKLKRHLKN